MNKKKMQGSLLNLFLVAGHEAFLWLCPFSSSINLFLQVVGLTLLSSANFVFARWPWGGVKANLKLYVKIENHQ